MLSYVQEGPAQFWKSDKADAILTKTDLAKTPKWKNFIKDFKESFEPLDMELDAQMKLHDLKIKKCANEYCYKFRYLANQTEYNDTAQIKVFKWGLLWSLMMKIMTRPEEKPENIKDWMNTAILYDKSYKQAQQYSREIDEEEGKA
ncbi:hypothetical protein Moror_865 [Moniliophthora roreri MCA 2997]|uniref:Retrotransposon gag domain-containing protein n=2 Tax=Moniliophthora roreri TaxID=221103 RepID=V2X7W0_MONRO|nr:hypothetical protein Moror_865 [Moniliophthora roreri MCA 2997]